MAASPRASRLCAQAGVKHSECLAFHNSSSLPLFDGNSSWRYPPDMFLVRGLLWLVLFIVLAFSFVVLFQYGPHNFADGFRKEFARVKSSAVRQVQKLEKPKRQR